MDAIETSETWDAGPMGCGELVMVLRLKLRAMPGRVVRVIARDPGAPEDIPAWCRMTRNELLRHEPDSHSFWIRSRTDWT
ncbi:sulfurtransferase TusA family protein [Enterovirga sp.]|uniref:sulfurtransferase TusA family protein n=1 Tax=Enterovirga sp. TaxID=2026350 RepID=UPI002C224645|nr:sulfurtransferase TusA family protein [Enterovirga sp.]HMO31108.1 sulfurtransferase TusA family protein [Enterovirga sp.]